MGVRAAMRSDTAFRTTFALLVIGMSVIRGYYRWRTRAANRQASFKESKRQVALHAILGLLGYLVLLLYVLAPRSLAWAALSLPAAVRWLGAGLGVVALVLLTWVHHTLGQNFSAILHVRQGHQLVMNGPYRWVRHPMYTVFFLFVLSWFLVSANWFLGLLWLAVVTAVVAMRVAHEEAVMLDQFGEQYRHYMQSTGRFLPRLTRRST